MVVNNSNHNNQAFSLVEEMLAEMQEIVNHYDCSVECARFILHSRHSRSSVHTKEFELTLVALDKLQNPLKL